MTPKQYFGLVAVALVAGIVGAVMIGKVAPQLGGSFAGGIVPNQLFTVNASADTVTPIVPNLAVTNALELGGTATANQLTSIYAGTSTIGQIVLGTTTSTSAATTTVITIPSGSVTVGEPCGLYGLTSAPSSTAFEMNLAITSVNAASSTASGTVTYVNGGAVSVTVATGTFRYVCGQSAF